MSVRLCVLAVFVGGLGVGCGDSSSSDEPLCQEPTKAGAGIAAYDEPSTDEFVQVDFDFACSEPTATGTCTFPVQVIDFEDDEFKPALGGTTVVIFPDNEVPDPSLLNPDVQSSGCAAPGTPNAPCYIATADNSGRVDFPGMQCGSLAAVYAHRASISQPITRPAIQFDMKVRDVVTDVLTISVSTYNVIPAVVGYEPKEGFGLVAGQVIDCGDKGISNVSVTVERGNLAQPASADFCGQDPIYGADMFYFVDNFPNADQRFTSEDGLWGMVNVPPGPITVFAGGARPAEGGHTENIGRRTAIAVADTITIVDVPLDPFGQTTCQAWNPSQNPIQAHDEGTSVNFDFSSCEPGTVAGTCTLTTQVVDFNSGVFEPQLAGTSVAVFPGNSVPDASLLEADPGSSGCATPGTEGSAVCWIAQAGNDGTAAFSGLGCGEKVAVYVHRASISLPITQPLVAYDVVVTDTAPVDVLALSSSTYNLVPVILGFEPDPGKGMVWGRAQDCAGSGVSQLSVNVESGTLSHPNNPTFCGYDDVYRAMGFYFEDAVPTGTQTSTSADGLWGYANVPAGRVTLFASGVLPGASESTVNIGRRTALSVPGVVTMVDLTLDAF